MHFHAIIMNKCILCVKVPRSIDQYANVGGSVLTHPLLHIYLHLFSRLFVSATVSEWLVLGLQPWSTPALLVVFPPSVCFHSAAALWTWPSLFSAFEWLFWTKVAGEADMAGKLGVAVAATGVWGCPGLPKLWAPGSLLSSIGTSTTCGGGEYRHPSNLRIQNMKILRKPFPTLLVYVCIPWLHFLQTHSAKRSCWSS